MFSYFLKNERKESSTLITSLLMLEANKNNSPKIMEPSSIKLSNERIILFSSFTFKLVETAKYKTSMRSPYPHDWLRTQAKKFGEKKFNII